VAHSDLVQSVLRAADILEVVGSSAEGMTLSEISGRLCLKAPTVHNLLRTLVKRGLLDRGHRPIRYRIGGGLFRLSRTSFERSLACRARGAVQRALTKEGVTSASFAELVGGEVCLMMRVDETRPDYVEALGGRPLHPYASGSSLVYQAFMSNGELSYYRERHPFSIQGAALWEHLDRLDDFLSQIRSNGVATVPSRDSAQTRVSAPVRHIDGRIAGAVTCVFGRDDDGAAAGPARSNGSAEYLVRALADELSVAGSSIRPSGQDEVAESRGYGDLE
jgi:DNA-binding IclR family transcriptional regulator